MTDGLIFDIKRFAVRDGPGIRTTVFFKGCPLSCWWCHNPESRSSEPQRSVKHLSLEGNLFKKDEITGYRTGIDVLLREVEKDRIFYEESGGGVTLSGGEPLYQPDFCEALLKNLKMHGLHTALDTTGHAIREVIDRMIPHTDLFLYDLKLMDDTEHRTYTGVSNEMILGNLRWLTDAGCEVIIRFPVIPEITDTDRNVDLMIGFLNSLKYPVEIHLLPYHIIARKKYQRFRMEDRMKSFKDATTERLSELKVLFTRAGFSVG